MSWWPPFGRRHEPDPRRWVVVDVETTGLDPSRDHLLAIAAVALQVDGNAMPIIDPVDSFEAVLRRDSKVVDKSNILLHGIGVGAQRGGIDPREALEQFEAWLGTSPLIGFHAAFDEAMILRATKTVLDRRLPNLWLDLDPLARIARPDVKARSLDEWLELANLSAAVRHQAASDALVTAQLLQTLWPTLLAQREPMDFENLRRRAAALRWLGRSG